MTDPIDERVALLLAERELKRVSARDWAIMCLEEGFDSKNLRMLAGAQPNDWPSVVDDYLSLALVELGWERFPSYVVLLRYAQSLAQQILKGQVDPIEGSEKLVELVRTNELRDDLSAWYEIEDALWGHRHFEASGIKDEYTYLEPAELDALIKDACAEFLKRTTQNYAELPETTFDEAEGLFKDFLADNGHASDVHWIFAEDLICDTFHPTISVPLPDDNREVARRLFEEGRQRDLGIQLFAFCLWEGVPCAFVILPEDHLDSQYRLMGNRYVKFSVRFGLMEAKPVRNRLEWAFKTFFARDRDRRARDLSIPSRDKL